MKWELLAMFVPVVAATVALGRTVADGTGEEGRGVDGRATVVVIALCAIALFLLGLGDVGVRERILVASCGGTVWLIARAQRDPRLLLATVCAAALLAGAEPTLGVGFFPALLLLVLGQRTLPPRLWSHGGLLLVVGVAVGYAIVGRTSAPLAAPTMEAVARWLDGAVHALGPVALVLAAAGLALRLTGASDGRLVALTTLLLLYAAATTGRFDAFGLWLVALSFGLGLLECAAHLSRVSLPGARLVLAPLVVLALAEPFTLRLSTVQLEWPSLGPVPPHAHAMRESCIDIGS